MPVPALVGGILSFASPNESIQRKGDPDTACFLRSSVLTGVAGRDILSLRQRAASLPHPFGQFLPKLSGITGWGDFHSIGRIRRAKPLNSQ